MVTNRPKGCGSAQHHPDRFGDHHHSNTYHALVQSPSAKDRTDGCSGDVPLCPLCQYVSVSLQDSTFRSVQADRNRSHGIASSPLWFCRKYDLDRIRLRNLAWLLNSFYSKYDRSRSRFPLCPGKLNLRFFPVEDQADMTSGILHHLDT